MAEPQARNQTPVTELMAAVERLTPVELEDFTRRLAQWRQRNGTQADEEATLLQRCQARLPAATERRLKLLNRKSERGTMTPSELEAYRTLARQAERLDVSRVEALTELARRRGQPVSAVMEAIGWENGGHEAKRPPPRHSKARARSRR
jgi:hypothetical protein